MTRLSLSLLGPVQVLLDGETVTKFAFDKVLALLAYLVVEAGRPHRRETLAGLLWPDSPERAARASLRRALSELRRTLGDRSGGTERSVPAFLSSTRDTIQFNADSDYWLDVASFRALLEGGTDEECSDPELNQAVGLYRGQFMEGFFLKDSAPFEDWCALVRERLQRQMLRALTHLADRCEQRGELAQAVEHARRHVELEPWEEAAHRRIMRLLAISGQRGAALAQYESCRQMLAQELGVEPATETRDLYERIRDGTLQIQPPSVPPRQAREPSFLRDHERYQAPLFVARKPELAQLDGLLELALAGRGRVGFVTGEAGSGKTALAQEFARRATESHPELVVAAGNCNAHTGIGDPYLAFREILALLTGDVEPRWAAGALSSEQARRLWAAAPDVAKALLGWGPDLVDVFIPGDALIAHATAAAGSSASWLNDLVDLVAHKRALRGPFTAEQTDLFSQFTRMLQHVATDRPLLLIVEDVHWIDVGSASLLFHLGRHIEADRILILGLYRPAEIAMGRPTAAQPSEAIAVSRQFERHPLEPVIHELQRRFGDSHVDLDQAEGRSFVDALVDSEPNRLEMGFRESLHRQGGGNPLFTHEMLRALQERHALVRDDSGRWAASSELDWRTLPARVGGVIEERIRRLPEVSQELLEAASVEGETFTAEAVAQVRRMDARDTVAYLTDLDRRHRLVVPLASQRLGAQRLSRYRFRHILLQNYLYESTDRVRRAYLHEAVGDALEALYGERAGEAAPQLARHFEQAGIMERAVAYLLQAGTMAMNLSAHQEAIAHLRRGLALLPSLPQGRQRNEYELALQLGLAQMFQATLGYSAPEVGLAAARAHELCAEVDQPGQALMALLQLNIYHGVRGELDRALALAEEASDLASRIGDPALQALASYFLGWVRVALGEFRQARAELEPPIALFAVDQGGAQVYSSGSMWALQAMAWMSYTLSYLGYLDQAHVQSQVAIESAHKLQHPFGLAHVLSVGCSVLSITCREYDAGLNWADEEIRHARERGLTTYVAMGTAHRGQALAGLGRLAEGIDQMRLGLELLAGHGFQMYTAMYLGFLAEAVGRSASPEEGLEILAQALTVMEETNERCGEAEILRIQGDLLLAKSAGIGTDEAESCYRHALEVARRQEAKLLELRAAMSLGRLWQQQGRSEEALEMVRGVYDWFTEGFERPDLREARAFLEDLQAAVVGSR